MEKIRSLNTSISEYRRNFYQIYHKTIVPMFEQYEIQRKNKCLFVGIICSILSFLLVCLVIDLYTEFSTSTTLNPIEIIIAIVVLLVLTVIPINANQKFISMLKSNCMMKILAAFGSISWIDNVNLITDYELNNSDLFSIYNRRTSADSFEGLYKGVNFAISETQLIYETGSGKNRRVENVFNGVVIKFAANKTIKNKTIIASRGDNKIKRKTPGLIITIVSFLIYVLFIWIDQGTNITSLFIFSSIALCVLIVVARYNYLGRKQQLEIFKEEVLSEIKLEDPDFSRKYTAYSSDQVEGRYLITPAFMERFNNIETAFGTHKVKCSFYRDSIMFAISTNKNLFEIGNLYHSLKDPKQMTVFFNELTSILALVDYFKLDENTGL